MQKYLKLSELCTVKLFLYLLLLCVVRMRVVCDYRWDGVCLTVSSFQTAGLPAGQTVRRTPAAISVKEPVAVILTGLTERATYI